MDALMNTYARLPVNFTRGEGAWLWDDQDKRYLDAVSGIAVCNLGHAHPAVIRPRCEQAGQLVHTSNIYHIATQEALGERIAAVLAQARTLGHEALVRRRIARLVVGKHDALFERGVGCAGAFPDGAAVVETLTPGLAGTVQLPAAASPPASFAAANRRAWRGWITSP